MSESARLIDAVVRRHLAPVMKIAGFRKAARTWHADVGHVVQVVNVQGSEWNAPDRARFTVNVGLWFPAVAELTGTNASTTRRPPEYLCVPRERLGFVMPDDRDVWWEVHGLDDVDDV